ncbi:MAG: SMC-Scp complex subunit ScpB [Saprospiraceae bacterium]
MNKKIQLNIEALIFSTEQPITPEEMIICINQRFQEELSIYEIDDYIYAIEEKYKKEDYFFELLHIAGGYQFLTKSDYHELISIHIKQKSKKRLSRAALETLSIIAYKQPVTKVQMEQVRGVNCDYAVQKLLEKELVTIMGRSDAPGRPLLYGTSLKFMDYFGMKDLKDLPKLKDFKDNDNEIGERASIEESNK